MKGTFHKSCSCAQCKRGRNAYKRNLNERKLRRQSKRELDEVVKGDDPENAVVAPISSPYTD